MAWWTESGAVLEDVGQADVGGGLSRRRMVVC